MFWCDDNTQHTGRHTKALNFSDATYVQWEGPDSSLLEPSLQKQWDHAFPSQHWQHDPNASAGREQRSWYESLPRRTSADHKSLNAFAMLLVADDVHLTRASHHIISPVSRYCLKIPAMSTFSGTQ